MYTWIDSVLSSRLTLYYNIAYLSEVFENFYYTSSKGKDLIKALILMLIDINPTYKEPPLFLNSFLHCPGAFKTVFRCKALLCSPEEGPWQPFFAFLALPLALASCFFAGFLESKALHLGCVFFRPVSGYKFLSQSRRRNEGQSCLGTRNLLLHFHSPGVILVCFVCVFVEFSLCSNPFVMPWFRGFLWPFLKADY